MGARYATSKKRDQGNTLSSIGLEDSPNTKKPPLPNKSRLLKDDSLEIESNSHPNQQIQLQNILDLLNDSKESDMIVPPGLSESESITKLLKIMDSVKQKKALESDMEKQADLDFEFEQCLL